MTEQRQNPPGVVKLVLEAVCIMLSIKPDRKPDPSTGRMVDDYWGPSVKLLGDMKFLDRLRLYDKDSIPPAVMQKIRQKSVEFPFSNRILLRICRVSTLWSEAGGELFAQCYEW